jgi:hypothetical protein
MGLQLYNAQASAKTLTLGSSTITCTNVAFTGTAPTVTHTGILNINHVAHVHDDFGDSTGWGTINFGMTPTGAAIYNIDGGDWGCIAFNIAMHAERRDTYIDLAQNIAISGDSSWIGGGDDGGDPTVRFLLRSSVIGTGTRTITVASTKNLTVTDCDVQDITVVVSGGGAVTGTRVGDCGGNTNCDCDAPKTVYCYGAAVATSQWTGTIWSTVNTNQAARAAAVDINNYPLPQDTAIIDGISKLGIIVFVMSMRHRLIVEIGLILQ